MSNSIYGRTKLCVPKLLLCIALLTMNANLAFAAADKTPAQIVSEPSLEWYESHVIEVKFKDSTRVRLRGGVPEDLNKSNAVANDLNQLLVKFPADSWSRSHSISEAKLETMRANGLLRSDRQLPDLNLYYQLQLPKSLTPGKAKQLIESYDSVQGAYYVQKPSPLPAAPDYSDPASVPTQGYLNAAPGGVNARGIWPFGWNGHGTQVCDVEYSFNPDHQDLPKITVVSGNTDDPFNDFNHGTAVFGEIVGLNDGAGVKGIAYAVSGSYFAGTYSAQTGINIGRAIIECAAAMNPGDVILIEQQAAGPFGCGVDQVGCVPVEWVKSTYDAIVTAVANGVIVVEASGNGAQNLDNAAYSVGNDNHWPFLAENDSGAIIVTGGTSTVPHGPLSFSNSGSTIDLQAWGHNIVTTGYGNLYSAEGVNLHYTNNFGGSSGASPIVVGAIAALQSGYRDLLGGALSPEAMRSLLRETGTPGAGALANAPLPNMSAASGALNNVIYVDSSAGGVNDGSNWANAYRELQDALFDATAGVTIAVAQGTQFPDFDGATGVVTSDPMDTFQLKNGVTLLGGYPSGGGTRDPGVNITTLTGNIGAVDTYHVVTGNGTDLSAVLDGFTIQGGVATGAAANDKQGGGIYISAGSPTIRDTKIIGNTATNGAGAYVINGSPTFFDVEFLNNSATNVGGGVYSNVSGTQFRNVTFRANNADNEGGGLFSAGTSTAHILGARFHLNTAFRGGAISNQSGSDLAIDNAVFTGNTASDLAGGILNFQAAMTLNNVTLAGNTSTSFSGGLYLFDPATIKNSIIWGNSGPQIGGPASATVSDSIVQGGYAGSNVVNADPSFRNLPGEDVRLDGATSPALNAADGGIANDCVLADISGHLRVGQCEMGAHEYRGSVSNFYDSGELDEEHLAISSDETGIGGPLPLRQSADDFVIGANQACDVTSIVAVLHDPTTDIQAVAEIFADAGGVPDATPLNSFSVGATPGQSLGALNGARLWEYTFDIPPTRLSEGTYWVSVYGAKESTENSHVSWVSAGDGNVQSNPYHYRQLGINWVNGGPFFGDIPRDLAMGIDASCGCGTDAGCDDGDPATLDLCDNLVCNNFLRPFNDDFDNALNISLGGGAEGSTLAHSTNDGSNSVGIAGQRDVWYRVTPPGPGLLWVNTCGTFAADNVDTTLSLHIDDGNTGSVANELEANDDYLDGSDPTACSNETSTLDSAIKLSVQGGDSVLVRVSEYNVDAIGDDFFLVTLGFTPSVDTDGDGIFDNVDNCTLEMNADQRDTNGDGYGNACDPDTNNNGTVEFGDISAWPPFFNQECSSTPEREDNDFDGDGFCNFGDYSLFPLYFQQPPGPSALAP